MELVENLIKLNILYVREMERKGILKIRNMGQLTEPLGVNAHKPTFLKSVNHLKGLIDKNSKISYLKEEIANLQEEISNSDIKDLQFWKGSFSEKESKLDTLVQKRLLFMETCFVTIKLAEQSTGISEYAIKQACQQERLLNTKKTASSWLVHLPEVRAYWDIEDTDLKSIYKDWEY